MSFGLRLLRLNWLVSVIILTLFMTAVPAFAQFPDLEVRVGDTTGSPGEQNSVISVYMRNWADTVAGFELWLYLERTDIMEFQTQYDTLYDTTFWRCTTGVYPDCIDSMDITDSVLLDPETQYDWMLIDEYQAYVGNHDVSGTLCENWEDISSRSIAGYGWDLKIVGRANKIAPPYTPGIGYPQIGEIPLVKILADIYDIPDTMEARSTAIFIQADNLDNFSFSDENGYGIGVITDTNLDTSWFVCDIWINDTCAFWSEVDEGPIDSVDSFWCCDTILTGHLDTSKVYITHGSLEVPVPPEFLCGDVNCSESINLLDVTFLINYLYKGGPPPCVEDAADVNSSGGINLLDATYLINYLYKGGPEPNCP